MTTEATNPSMLSTILAHQAMTDQPGEGPEVKAPSEQLASWTK
jgi:hypothetical protein